MSDSKTYIGCPKCVSFAGYDSEDEAKEAVEDHNSRMHGEDGPATIIHPDSKDSVNEFVDTAREITPEKQYKKLIRKITRDETPFTVATLG